MTLIAAALMQEARVVLQLLANTARVKIRGVRAWRATRRNRTVYVLKTGMGPARSERILNVFLGYDTPRRILVVGYGGALSESLKLGDLVIAERASLLHYNSELEEMELSETWEMDIPADFTRAEETVGFSLRRGNFLTTTHLVGEPRHKLMLNQRFQATMVDMETATLARAAQKAGIPLSCVRVVSDEATDDLLAPFSQHPGAGLVSRSAKIVSSRNLIHRHGQWKAQAREARKAMRRFLAWYLDNLNDE